MPHHTDKKKTLQEPKVSYLRYGKGRAPLLFENVKTYTAIAIDVGMENFRPERNLSNTRKTRIVENDYFPPMRTIA